MARSSRYGGLVALAVGGSLLALSASPASAKTVNKTANGSVTCSFSATIKFWPPLTNSGGGTKRSKLKADLLDCTTSGVNSSEVTVPSGSFSGSLAESPFSCVTGTATGAPVTGTAKWARGSYFGQVAAFQPSTIHDSVVSGSFEGMARVSLNLPSTMCAMRKVPSALVTGTFIAGPTTTTTSSSSSVGFVQADDTGTINGNTTSIGSGQSNQVLAHDTGIGHSVVLIIQTLTAPGTETDTVTSISSGMGTFQFVNSYNDGADNEIWVCTDTTGAADTVTVTTPTNAWNAFAIEFNRPATGFVNGGGQVVDLPYLADQSWTVSPGAAGNVAVIGVDTADAFTTGPAAPWTYYNSGYWSFINGTSAAWQVAPSSSPLTATWGQDGGEISSQGVVLEY